jgi:hypothetical protein
VSSTDDDFRLGVSTSKLKDLQEDKSRTAYCKVGADIITYCLEVTTGAVQEPKTTFSPEMADAGRGFMRSLMGTSTRNQDEAFQTFLFSLFNQKRTGQAKKYVFLTYTFLAIYSFTEHGNLRACANFSQFFSKVIFFARAAIFNKINSHAVQEKKGFFE